MRLLVRLLLAVSCLIFGFGGVMHALAYRASALRDIDASNLAPFLGSEVKVLWLADSTTLIALALITGFIALRPRSANGAVIMLIGLVPAATALLLYAFLGGFYAGHMLMAAAAMVFLAGALTPASHEGG